MDGYKESENGRLQGTRKSMAIRYQKMESYKIPENGWLKGTRKDYKEFITFNDTNTTCKI